jgi:hypothetical protein
LIEKLLKHLVLQQKRGLDKNYLPGIFSSQRFHSFLPYRREDENIFFSSAIVYTLQEHYDSLSKNSRTIVDDLIKQVIKCYPSFKNFRGKKTYNFFKTQPMNFFPNGKIMQHFDFFKLADDADDTIYVYLTHPKKRKHKKLKQKLIKHANGTLKWSSHKSIDYKKLKTYGVYFGKNMPIEVDACVLSNILLWSSKNKLNTYEQDKDSITYIVKSIISKDYINTPHLISPCYPTTAQICYHYSRLIKNTNEKHLSTVIKLVLIDDIKSILKTRHSFIDTLFYHIALLNMGIILREKLKYKLSNVLRTTNYFYTSIPLMIPKLWVRKLQKHKIFKTFELRTKCDGYTTTLLLEYEILHKSMIS